MSEKDPRDNLLISQQKDGWQCQLFAKNKGKG